MTSPPFNYEVDRPPSVCCATLRKSFNASVNDHLASLQNECRALARTIRQADQEQQQLEAQETEVVNQLATEQSRWVDFNSRLDEIERQLTIR